MLGAINRQLQRIVHLLICYWGSFKPRDSLSLLSNSQPVVGDYIFDNEHCYLRQDGFSAIFSFNCGLMVSVYLRLINLIIFFSIIIFVCSTGLSCAWINSIYRFIFIIIICILQRLQLIIFIFLLCLMIAEKMYCLK